MAAKTTDWRPGPTVCRCCLSEGCYKDISTEYFWMGKREVYSEMLSETFSLSIAYSTSGGPNSNSRLICEPCISRLRDASDFKRQVQECEKTFMQYLDPGTERLSDFETAESRIEVTLESLETEVKVEQVKTEKDESDGDDFGDRTDFPDLDDDDDDLDDQPLTRLATRVPKKESVDTEADSKPEKRKATTKAKTSPAKKAKTKKEVVKATTSKAAKPTEKKKKGQRGQTEIKVEEMENIPNRLENSVPEKRRYQRSARGQARVIIKRNASIILNSWTVCPFRWKNSRFMCAYCDTDFSEFKPLRDHVRLCTSKHTVKDIYRKYKELPQINIDVTDAHCNICSASFTDVSHMREHVIQHDRTFDPNHPDGVLPFYLNKESWKCVLCQAYFTTFLKLYKHMNVHYQHYICATCGKGYMTATRLRKHSEVHISGSFPCNECGKVFLMRASRDAHKARAHAKGPRYGCPYCSLRFDGYYVRMAHLNEAHREKKVIYNCSLCEATFKTSAKRSLHLKTVHFPRQKDVKCLLCGKRFSSSKQLKSHMFTHTGKKEHHCNVCGKDFSSKAGHSRHMKQHEVFICEWCSTVFPEQTLLVEHMKTNHPQLDDLEITVSQKCEVPIKFR
ncbi:zinc finger protein 354A-like isoform X6 [Ostrinia nubilalis]|uniref:zinc finger protein 354A-like isoform X6 n=1 Tax=Ostrinia nubilalis TaxID=29057 RepID=UPI00308237B4